MASPSKRPPPRPKFSGEHFVQIATALQNLAGSYDQKKHPAKAEAARRSAIGRLYYAAFLQLRPYLNRTGRKVSQSKHAHQEVINHLLNSQNQLEQDAGAAMESLRDARNLADYGGMNGGIDWAQEVANANTYYLDAVTCLPP